MKIPIETIWKEGFLNEKSLAAPAINDLYNQKSKHLVNRVDRMFRINLYVLLVIALIIPVIYYFLDATWQGVAASILLLLTAWYNKRQLRHIDNLDQGATSLDYLISLEQWLKTVLLKGEKIARLSYPLYILIAIGTIWSAWNKQGVTLKIRQKFPALFLIEDYPVFMLLMIGTSLFLIVYISAKIYQFEVRLMYGRVLDKLEETIIEMKKLKQGF
ncbi:hypothetical protein [Dyadobacter sp. BHUBP1]|uniref:hypothetical protein n=1 Tax=Dyadobacter sp. BHUBP1 TaxID=3424178 RepID=UPI003D34FA57